VESVSFVGIDIKIIAWDESNSCAMAEDWLEVPPAVDAHNVEDYVVGRFGEPVDVAMGRTDGFGEIVMGWVFPSAALDRVELPSDGLAMMVVPFVRFPDGSRRELFEYAAELNSEFAALAASVEPGVVISTDLVPVDARGRLETERLQLVGSEREDLELQIGGWLRRMLAEGWTYLILEKIGTGRYVQFLTHEGSWLRGEAVGDRYLQGHAPISPDEHQRLCDLGWNPPEDEPGGCGNYWVDWGHDDEDPHRTGSVDDVTDRDVGEAARFAAAALCEVFGPISVDRVDVMAGPAPTTPD
jgi:hypothetical protein